MPRVPNVALFTNFTMNQDGYSNPFDLQMVTGYSIQAIWTGSPTGILFIQVSNDNTTPPTNWSIMTPSLINTNGVSNNHLWKQYLAPFRWLRFGYAFSGGTGTLNVRLNCKGTD